MSSLILLAVMAAAAAPDPITLSAERDGPAVRLSVVGNSAVAMQASYELVAESGSGNRSVQKGRVDLFPGRRVVLLSLGLGHADRGWSARLTVETPDQRYEKVLHD